MSRRAANACALLTKLRKLPTFFGTHGQFFSQPHVTTVSFVITKPSLRFKAENQFICEPFLDLRPPIAEPMNCKPRPLRVWVHHAMKVLSPP